MYICPETHRSRASGVFGCWPLLGQQRRNTYIYTCIYMSISSSIYLYAHMSRNAPLACVWRVWLLTAARSRRGRKRRAALRGSARRPCGRCGGGGLERAREWHRAAWHCAQCSRFDGDSGRPAVVTVFALETGVVALEGGFMFEAAVLF